VRVGLDARTLAAERHSGVEQYIIHLVRGLAELPDAPEIVCYTDRPIPDPDLARVANSGSIRTTVLRARRGWLRAALPWRLWRDGVDLVHLPSTILPPLLPCPAVVTFYDLAWRRFPETYDPGDLRMQSVALKSALRATHVISDSHATGRDLQEAGLAPEKITVIPLGVSTSFSADGSRLSADAFPEAARLADGYVLCIPGGLRARKNLRRLIDAYRRVRETAPAPPLVIVGGLTPHGEELIAHARTLDLDRDVIFPGYLPDELLPVLYRSATLFVYPSLYEGFGLPILEAMASGVPVVTSNTSAMAEVGGEAAVLVNPEDTEALASAIGGLLADEGARRDLVQRGLDRSRSFAWERTVRETADLYRSLIVG
jgi:glycosyltransferase involved in cell wall biosynthesis